jgi:tetratricopeptide (TPR) repeat protein
MTNNKKICLIIGIALGLVTTHLALAEESPQIILLAGGELNREQTSKEPLLLFMQISGGNASTIQAMNRQNEAMLIELTSSRRWKDFPKEQQKKLLDRYRVIQPPRFTLGSEASTIESLITFSAENEAGEPVTLNIQPLRAAPKTPGVVILEGESTLMLYFGASADELSRLAKGTYVIQAKLDAQNTDGMWSGQAASNAIRLRLGAVEETASRIYQAGLYYRLDGQYEQLGKVADRLIELDSNNVGGWTHKADSLDGLGDTAEALEAFQTAIQKHRKENKKDPGGVPEPPAYITRRILEIRQQSNSAKTP